MSAQNIAMKAVVTPLLIGGASLAGRRFGHHVGGWLVALPLTSGPVAFFLVIDRGAPFATNAAIGMLGGTISQVGFALSYSATVQRGPLCSFLAGSATFATVTTALAFVHWNAFETFVLVVGTLLLGFAIARRRPSGQPSEPTRSPRWDIPIRMVAATLVVLLITTSAPLLGPHLTGLLSPFPVFGAVLAVVTHHTHGAVGAAQTLDGLVLGLLAPAVFFLALALMLPNVGLVAFVVATAAAFAAQAATILAIPPDRASDAAW